MGNLHAQRWSLIFFLFDSKLVITCVFCIQIFLLFGLNEVFEQGLGFRISQYTEGMHHSCHKFSTTKTVHYTSLEQTIFSWENTYFVISYLFQIANDITRNADSKQIWIDCGGSYITHN